MNVYIVGTCECAAAGVLMLKYCTITSRVHILSCVRFVIFDGVVGALAWQIDNSF